VRRIIFGGPDSFLIGLATFVLVAAPAIADDEGGESMRYVEPSEAQIAALRELPPDEPFVMLNLLKFKPEGGAEMYAEYAGTSTRLVYELGGEYIYYGESLATVIGGEEWDAVVLVRYPTLMSFFQMVSSPEYQAAVHLRHGALEDSRLIAVETLPAEDTPGWQLAFPAAEE
jgi:uncharacterized protein (DUF1330 family)